MIEPQLVFIIVLLFGILMVTRTLLRYWQYTMSNTSKEILIDQYTKEKDKEKFDRMYEGSEAKKEKKGKDLFFVNCCNESISGFHSGILAPFNKSHPQVENSARV